MAGKSALSLSLRTGHSYSFCTEPNVDDNKPKSFFPNPRDHLRKSKYRSLTKFEGRERSIVGSYRKVPGSRDDDNEKVLVDNRRASTGNLDYNYRSGLNELGLPPFTAAAAQQPQKLKKTDLMLLKDRKSYFTGPEAFKKSSQDVGSVGDNFVNLKREFSYEDWATTAEQDDQSIIF